MSTVPAAALAPPASAPTAMRRRWHLRLGGVWDAGLRVTLLCLLLAWLDRWCWLGELCANLRVQYAVIFAAGAVVALARRRRAAAAWWALLALLNTLYFGGVWLPPPTLPNAPVAATATPLRTLALNVHTENDDYAALAALVRREQPDLILFEEVNGPWLAALHAALDGDYPASFDHGRDDNFGIACFSRYPLSPARVEYLEESYVPTLVATVDLPSGPLLLLGVHPNPPGFSDATRADRDGVLMAAARLAAAASGPVVLMGDLNTVPWTHSFRRFATAGALRDTRRGCGLLPSWPTLNPLLYLPLDHCLVGGPITVLRRWCGPRVGSDHLPGLPICCSRRRCSRRQWSATPLTATAAAASKTTTTAPRRSAPCGTTPPATRTTAG